MEIYVALGQPPEVSTGISIPDRSALSGQCSAGDQHAYGTKLMVMNCGVNE